MIDDEDRARAFETLYRSTLPSLRSYARRRAPVDLAEDVVAQTYLTAWRRCDEALSGGLPWLYRTAGFTLANHERAERRQWRVAQRVISTTEPTTPDRTDEVVRRTLLLDAIELLPRTDREVLLLVYWEHLSVKALAVALDCRPGTAAVRVHRARRKLRDALSEHPKGVRPTPPTLTPKASEVTP